MIDKSEHIKAGDIQGYAQPQNPLQIRTYKQDGREEVVGITRLSTKNLQDILERGHDDALMEIEKAKRILSGALDIKTMNLNEVRVKGMSLEEYKIDLERDYKDWCVFMNRNSPQAYSVVMQVVDQVGVEEILAKEQFMGKGTFVRLLTMGLETWQDIRGRTRTKVRIPPTARQQEVLDTIQTMYQQNGEMPTYREIAKKLGISSHTNVAELINRLEQKGWIHRIPAQGIALI